MTHFLGSVVATLFPQRGAANLSPSAGASGAVRPTPRVCCGSGEAGPPRRLRADPVPLRGGAHPIAGGGGRGPCPHQRRDLGSRGLALPLGGLAPISGRHPRMV